MDEWTGNNNTCDRSNVSVTRLRKTWANIWKLSENTTKHIGELPEFYPPDEFKEIKPDPEETTVSYKVASVSRLLSAATE